MPLLLEILFTSVSYLWLLACLILGLGYATVLYKAPTTLGTSLRAFLFALRTLAISFIAFLLFAPLIKTIDRSLEKPLIIIAQDNSASIRLAEAKGFNLKTYNNQLKKLEKELSGEYELRSFNFDDTVTAGLELNYNGILTDISSVFRMIDDHFSNRNIGAVILGTDGIYNRGPNPQYDSKKLQAPLYTIALGDTLARRDLLISNINYNHIAYLGNEFQISVSVEAYQLVGSSTRLSVSQGGEQLISKTISINSNEFRQDVLLTLPAKAKGVQPYKISLSPLSNELSLVNNSQTIFVEVMDGRKNVLIIANAPHPDLSAIRQSIESNKNYSIEISLAHEINRKDVEQADLLILHQVPSLNYNAKEVLQLSNAKPIWYILGAQSNVSGFSIAQNLLTINSALKMQDASSGFNSDFYSFNLSDSSKIRISDFGPLQAPFGNYALKGSANVLIKQKIGKVNTEKPLLLFGDEGSRRIGILSGEGIWRWRLEDFRENSNHKAIDELILKTVQYLISSDDKRKFRAYPAKNAFDENERVLLNAELYNDSFELLNHPEVNISLKNDGGRSYSFTFSRTSNSYILNAGILPPGEYNYLATTSLGNEKYQVNGKFSIAKQETEYRQSIANHQLLYVMAVQNAGKMIFPNQLNELPALIKANENVKTVSYEDHSYKELIDLKLLFFLILGLLCVEWLSRKRSGEI